MWALKRGEIVESKILVNMRGCQDCMYSSFTIIVEPEGRRALEGLCLLISIGTDRNYGVMAPSYKWKWPFALNGSEAIYCELWCGSNIIDSKGLSPDRRRQGWSVQWKRRSFALNIMTSRSAKSPTKDQLIMQSPWLALLCNVKCINDFYWQEMLLTWNLAPSLTSENNSKNSLPCQ